MGASLDWVAPPCLEAKCALGSLVSPAAKKRADKRDQNERKLASSCQSRWAIGAPPCAQLELAKCTSLEPKLALTTSLAIEVAMELASLAGLWRKRADQHD